MSLPETLTADEPSTTSPSVSDKRMRRIKVVFVIDNMSLGGTELNAVRTAEHLDRERFELLVVCLSGDGPLTERYQTLGVPVLNLGLRSFYGPSMLSTGWRFVRLLRREGADIVHAHDIYSNIFVAAWGRLGGARAVIVSRRWWQASRSRMLRIGSHFAFARASAVLANSAQVADSVAEEGQVPRTKIWTVTNFADDAMFGAASDDVREAIRRGWKVPAAAVVIGCVARLDPVKDHATLLTAFARLRLGQPGTYLVVIGDGESRQALESQARELGLGDAVHFAGEIRDGTNLHRGLDISVLASRSEGFPNTLVEAMAAAVPVVATAVGGSVDAVTDGETGFLVPAGEPDKLADALTKLVESPSLRRTMGAAGLRRASQSYRAPGVVGALEHMYEHLVGAN